MDLVDETEEQTERVRKTKTKTIGCVWLQMRSWTPSVCSFSLSVSEAWWALGNGQWQYYNILCTVFLRGCLEGG